MLIFNNACVQDSIAFDATIWPSSIRSEATGEVLLFPRPMSTSRYVPPTIRFGSLVFEHQKNVDSPRPNSILVGSIPIGLSSGQISTELDSGGNDPDFDRSEDEIHLVQDCRICATSQHRKVIHTKRLEICTSQHANDNVHFVEIAQSGFYTKPCPGRWLDGSMPIKKGDPGHPVISIAIG
jgi:hypothetical protein